MQTYTETAGQVKGTILIEDPEDVKDTEKQKLWTTTISSRGV
jgi:hypothetical protein